MTELQPHLEKAADVAGAVLERVARAAALIAVGLFAGGVAVALSFVAAGGEVRTWGPALVTGAISIAASVTSILVLRGRPGPLWGQNVETLKANWLTIVVSGLVSVLFSLLVLALFG